MAMAYSPFVLTPLCDSCSAAKSLDPNLTTTSNFLAFDPTNEPPSFSANSNALLLNPRHTLLLWGLHCLRVSMFLDRQLLTVSQGLI